MQRTNVAQLCAFLSCFYSACHPPPAPPHPLQGPQQAPRHHPAPRPAAAPSLAPPSPSPSSRLSSSLRPPPPSPSRQLLSPSSSRPHPRPHPPLRRLHRTPSSCRRTSPVAAPVLCRLPAQCPRPWQQAATTAAAVQDRHSHVSRANCAQTCVPRLVLRLVAWLRSETIGSKEVCFARLLLVLTVVLTHLLSCCPHTLDMLAASATACYPVPQPYNNRGLLRRPGIWWWPGIRCVSGPGQRWSIQRSAGDLVAVMSPDSALVVCCQHVPDSV